MLFLPLLKEHRPDRIGGIYPTDAADFRCFGAKKPVIWELCKLRTGRGQKFSSLQPWYSNMGARRLHFAKLLIPQED
jgi:hypothetical protein